MELTAIGINGLIASGKSTTAKAICALDARYKRVAFADELKCDVYDIFHLHSLIKLNNRADKIDWVNRNKATLREMLQHYGVSQRRLNGADYWVMRLLARTYEEGLTHVVVDDMRFPNEAEGLRRASGGGFLAVRLLIDIELQDERCERTFGYKLSDQQRSHISEIAMDAYEGFDAVIPIKQGAEIEPDLLAAGLLAIMISKSTRSASAKAAALAVSAK